MNSAPTAEEQLPPLDITPEESERCGQYATVVCRERQLLAALRENREKDVRIAELEKHGNLQFEEVHNALDHAESAEAKLRAVSDALKRIGYHPALVTELRAILEGK